MSEKNCYDKLKIEMRVYFVCTLIFIALANCGLYKKIKDKIYHTSFIQQDIQKQIFGVNIDYDKSRRKIEVTPAYNQEPLFKKLIQE